MKIEQISIDGFGSFHSSDFGPLDGGVVIFFGPNEAGKSTLHRFIQAILFGFPRAKSPNWSPPLNGGKHGGRIILHNGTDCSFTVERHATGANRGAQVYANTDGAGPQAPTLPELLGGLNGDVFSSVFAIELDDLQSLDSLPDDEVSGRIYGAGFGAERLPAALADFEKHSREIYLERGRIQPVAKTLKSLQTIDSKLAVLQNEAETYYQLQADADDVQQQVKQFHDALRSGREKRDRYRSWLADIAHSKSSVRRTRAALDAALDDYDAGGSTLPILSPEQLQIFRRIAIKYQHSLTTLATEIDIARRDLKHQEAEHARSLAQLEQRRSAVADSAIDQTVGKDVATRREDIANARIAWSRLLMARQVLENMQLLMPARQSSEIVLPIALLLSSLTLIIVGIISGGMVFLVACLLAVGLLAAAGYFLNSGRAKDRQKAVSLRRMRADLAESQTAFASASEQLGIDPSTGERGLVIAETEVELHREAQFNADHIAAAEREVDERRAAQGAAQSSLDALEIQYEECWQAWTARITQLGVDKEPSPDSALEQSPQIEAIHQLQCEQDAAQCEYGELVQRIQQCRDRADEPFEVAELEHELADLDEDLEALEARHTAALHRSGDLQSEMRRLESETSAAELRAQREAAHAQLRTLAREWSVYTIGHSLLDQARRQYEEERRPGVIQTASEAFSAITGGVYKRIIFPLDGSQQVQVEAVNASRIPVNNLSRGAREQLYLALRFGLIREFGRQSQPLPVLLDDIMVNFDPVRARATAHALAQLVAHHQILLFTCHPQTVKLLCSIIPGTQVVELDQAPHQS